MKPKKRKVPKPKLMTDICIRKYLKMVDEVGRRRNQLHENFSPADFAAGAGVILEYLGRLDLLPAEWVFGIMLGNRNPFEDKKDEKGSSTA